jgi:hypothetical protein
MNAEQNISSNTEQPQPSNYDDLAEKMIKALSDGDTLASDPVVHTQVPNTTPCDDNETPMPGFVPLKEDLMALVWHWADEYHSTYAHEVIHGIGISSGDWKCMHHAVERLQELVKHVGKEAVLTVVEENRQWRQDIMDEPEVNEQWDTRALLPNLKDEF